MLTWQDSVMSDEQLAEIGYPICISPGYRVVAQAQAELSFKMGGENEKAKVRAIYKDAGDLKELETRIKEYLDTTTSDID